MQNPLNMEIEPSDPEEAALKSAPEKVTTSPEQGSCCSSRKCLGCCCCCCLLVLIALGLMSYFLWPRLVVVCAAYAKASFDLEYSGTAPSASFNMILPFTISSKLLVTIYDIDIDVDAYSRGNYDATLAHGRITGFDLAAEGNSTFEVVLSPVELSPAQVQTVADYFVDECGPTLLLGSWFADFRLTVDLYGQDVTVWIRDIELPCVAAGVALVGPENEDSCDESASKDSQPLGKYCISLLCAVDDLQCEEACED